MYSLRPETEMQTFFFFFSLLVSNLLICKSEHSESITVSAIQFSPEGMLTFAHASMVSKYFLWRVEISDYLWLYIKMYDLVKKKKKSPESCRVSEIKKLIGLFFSSQFC